MSNSAKPVGRCSACGRDCHYCQRLDLLEYPCRRCGRPSLRAGAATGPTHGLCEFCVTSEGREKATAQRRRFDN